MKQREKNRTRKLAEKLSLDSDLTMGIVVGIAVGGILAMLLYFSTSARPSAMEYGFFFFFISVGSTMGIASTDLRKELADKNTKTDGLVFERSIVIGLVGFSFLIGLIVSYTMPIFFWCMVALALSSLVSWTVNAKGRLGPLRYSNITHKKIAKRAKLPFYSSWLGMISFLMLSYPGLLDLDQASIVFLVEVVMVSAVLNSVLYPTSISEVLKEKKAHVESLEKDYLKSKARRERFTGSVGTGTFMEGASETEEGFVAETRYEFAADEITDGGSYISGLKDYCTKLEDEYQSLSALLS